MNTKSKPKLIPLDTTKVIEVVFVNGQRRVNVVTKDGTPRTITQPPPK